MTNIVFRDDHIELVGHAGNESVCTAVSMLSFTLIYSLKHYQDTGEINFLEIEMNEEDGVIRIDFENEDGRDVNVMLDTIYRGYSLLAEQFPDHVRFI